MIPIQYQKNTRFFLMGIFGTLMTVCGFLIYHFNPLEYTIKTIAVLAPNTIMFNLWTKPPYEVFVNVYIFNVTNSEDFLRNGTKMKMEQVGPYAYQEVLINGNARFNGNGTMTFEPKRHLIFRREHSVGDPSIDTVISPNIPLLGITSSLKDSSFFTNIALSQIANALDSKVFLNLTIDEYLWGYDDRLVELANKVLPNWINFPRFGIMDRLMALDNASNIVTIKTGRDAMSDNDVLSQEEKERPYTIMTFNGSPGLHQWGYKDLNNTAPSKSNTRCNTIEGSFEGGVFPDNMRENETIRLYRRAFCRPVDLKYENSDPYQGYDSMSFRIDQKFLETPEENPNNDCYCLKNKCPKKGIGYLNPCYYDIPVVISQPHFLNSDPSLSEQVEGMKPNVTLHDTTLKIHKQLGIPLEANLRIQINLNVDTKYSSKCKPFNGLTLPLFWLEMTIEEVPFLVKLIINLLYSILPVAQQVAIWVFILLGPAMVAAAALFTFYGPTNHGLEDPYDNRIGYSPIRIIPMTAYLNPPTIRISK